MLDFIYVYDFLCRAVVWNGMRYLIDRLDENRVSLKKLENGPK